MEVVATAKWVRTTARKARLVTATVEGLPVAEALVILKFTPRAAARDVANVIKSAAANAEHNYNLDSSTLRVARVEVEAAAIIKRFRPKPRGMSGSIFKRTAHLRAFVTDDEPTPRNRVRSKIRMPRTVVTAPAAGPSRETPAPRRARGGSAARGTSGGAASAAASASAATPGVAPTRRRRGTKAADTAVADAAVTDEAAEDATETTASVDATAEPAHDTGEGDKG
ncbi:MAG: 50S ribosomal protein L22 [Candidatus Aeolococcus gillhamiae]|uniref:Large ribosomal subunit protein uL22 n=2 Tax=Candidatus Aeolococcus gillhamiae TaxID=3127015 RepID=A0A2W5ZAT1_9BACT|nr:MAG: 50S ribosomal protein L22 [Candidatus Dormibacter sp. RRmetagenome_bin12]